MDRMIESMNRGLKRKLHENMTIEEYENDPFIVSLKSVCSGYGYELRDFYFSSYYNKPVVDIYPKDSSKPEIHFSNRRRGEEPEFRISTFSVGFFPIEEYEEFVANMQSAISLVRILQTQIPKLQEKGIVFNEKEDF